MWGSYYNIPKAIFYLLSGEHMESQRRQKPTPRESLLMESPTIYPYAASSPDVKHPLPLMLNSLPPPSIPHSPKGTLYKLGGADYLGCQGDLVSIPTTPISRRIALVIPVSDLLTKAAENPSDPASTVIQCLLTGLRPFPLASRGAHRRYRPLTWVLAEFQRTLATTHLGVSLIKVH